MRTLFLAVGMLTALLANPLHAFEQINTTIRYVLPNDEEDLYLMTQEGDLWFSDGGDRHLRTIEEGEEVLIYATTHSARLMREGTKHTSRLKREGSSDLTPHVLTHQVPCTQKTTVLTIGDELWLAQSEVEYHYWEDPEVIPPVSAEWEAGDQLLLAKSDANHAHAVHVERREACPLIGLTEKAFVTVEANKLLDYTFSDGTTWSAFPNAYSFCESWKGNDELYTARDDFRKLAKLLEIDAKQLLASLGNPGWSSTYNREVMLCFNPRTGSLAFLWR